MFFYFFGMAKTWIVRKTIFALFKDRGCKLPFYVARENSKYEKIVDF
jgi:hypothetical protein